MKDGRTSSITRLRNDFSTIENIAALIRRDILFSFCYLVFETCAHLLPSICRYQARFWSVIICAVRLLIGKRAARNTSLSRGVSPSLNPPKYVEDMLTLCSLPLANRYSGIRNSPQLRQRIRWGAVLCNVLDLNGMLSLYGHEYLMARHESR